MKTEKAAVALAAAALSVVGQAAAEIVVSPLRQVVTRSRPAAVYEIVNASDRIVDGRVGWIDLSAVETGYATASPAARAALSAAPYLVVSPARFRLEPGKRADVSVRLKKGATIPAGERRSHLVIETTPVRTPLRRAGGGLEVDVELGVSTPVILRGGLAAPSVAFSATRLVRDPEGLLALETTLTRSGKYSAYGTLVAELKSAGHSGIIAKIDNVAVHADAGTRRLSVPLDFPSLPAGVLTLRYEGAAEYEGRLFAEKKFEVAPPE